MILYDDPMSSAPKAAQHLIYPNGPFLPADGVQRGSITDISGDPLTPEYPSTEYAYRINEDDAMLPTIPALAIGYGLAYRIFKLMEANGKTVSDDDWKGELNMTYTYGGKLDGGRLLTLNVFNQRRIEKTYNVMGLIKGSVEPGLNTLLIKF